MVRSLFCARVTPHGSSVRNPAPLAQNVLWVFYARLASGSRSRGVLEHGLAVSKQFPIVPAKAGIEPVCGTSWVPAFAGTSGNKSGKVS